MKACENGHIEIVKMLLDKGVNLNQCDWTQCSPSTIAYKMGHRKIEKMLSAENDRRDKRGESTLFTACEQDHAGRAKMLLDREADCDKCEDRGNQLYLRLVYRITQEE